jgi:hypothetical protein
VPANSPLQQPSQLEPVQAPFAAVARRSGEHQRQAARLTQRSLTYFCRADSLALTILFVDRLAAYLDMHEARWVAPRERIHAVQGVGDF